MGSGVEEIDRTRLGRARGFQIEAPPATGMVVGGPTAMSKAVEPTGVVDTGTGMTGIEGAREATGGAGQTKSILIETTSQT